MNVAAWLLMGNLQSKHTSCVISALLQTQETLFMTNWLLQPSMWIRQASRHNCWQAILCLGIVTNTNMQIEMHIQKQTRFMHKPNCSSVVVSCVWNKIQVLPSRLHKKDYSWFVFSANITTCKEISYKRRPPIIEFQVAAHDPWCTKKTNNISSCMWPDVNLSKLLPDTKSCTQKHTNCRCKQCTYHIVLCPDQSDAETLRC